MTALEKATGDAVFKFEPFVLHVLCRELQDAQLLVKPPQIQCGFVVLLHSCLQKIKMLAPG